MDSQNMSLQNMSLTFKDYFNNYIYNSNADELTNDWGWYIDIDIDKFIKQRKFNINKCEQSVVRYTRKLNNIRVNKSINSLQDLCDMNDEENQLNTIYNTRKKNKGFSNDSIYPHTLGMFGIIVWYYFAYLY